MALLSTRRVWIEITFTQSSGSVQYVTLHTESMDWNHTGRARVTIAICVTLHTESMDWNFELTIQFLQLLKLLSTRRVWIEIEENIIYNKQPSGYSPHGEYGLKSVCDDLKKVMLRLLSTRRVWIEIFDVNRAELWYTGYSPHGEYGLKSLRCICILLLHLVTLHTESMDWNNTIRCFISIF